MEGSEVTPTTKGFIQKLCFLEHASPNSVYYKEIMPAKYQKEFPLDLVAAVEGQKHAGV